MAIYTVYQGKRYRATVTLGDDAPHDEARLRSFHYDENGVYVVHD